MLTPTHQAKVGSRGDVTAWQFSLTANIPIWVARRFHVIEMGSGKWQALAGATLVTAKTGDWAVWVPDETLSDGKIRPGAILVFTDKEFRELFQPLPPAKDAQPPKVITAADVEKARQKSK